MGNSRLTLASRAGLLGLPAQGDIAVFNPVVSTDISALPKDRLQIIQGFYPDHHWFEEQGFNVATEARENFSAAIVFLPRSKLEARGIIAQAMAVTSGGPVIVDGQKTDGIESILKDCRAQSEHVSGVYSKAHGKLFTISGGDFSGWALQAPSQIEGGFNTVAGVFSADGIDRGSSVLAAALPASLSGKVADMGAGWGYLSHHILDRDDVTECHLIEAQFSALTCARANISDQRAHFHWADARYFNAVSGFDHIVTNPPFHTGRVADPDLGRSFISAASRLLKPRGVVWLVANRHLPYEQHLSAVFKEVAEVGSDRAFKVFRASVIRPQKN